MQARYPASFERDMACTEADWLRWLPLAIGTHAWHAGQGSATVSVGAGRLELAWTASPPRAIALVRLPRLHVAFRFEEVDESARAAFMRRFDLYMQRGGG